MKNLFYLLILVTFFACSEKKNEKIQTTPTIIPFTKQGELKFFPKLLEPIQLDIEIADTDQKRALGLMYRNPLTFSQAMLFIFEEETPQSFWMKNTPSTLDILFVNRQMEIVQIHEFTQPYSEKSYPSERPAIYVVEVAGGFVSKYQITEGDKIEFSRN